MPIYVPLDRDAMERLRSLASHEHRHPRMQAKLLLEQAIRERAGSSPSRGPRRGTR
jgi:hypothetical protein